MLLTFNIYRQIHQILLCYPITFTVSRRLSAPKVTILHWRSECRWEFNSKTVRGCDDNGLD